MNTHYQKHFALVLLFSSFAAVTSNAQTVAWGTSLSSNPLAFNSNGTVDNSQNLWTLGYFTTGFTPNQDNFSSWAGNWNPVSSLVPEDDPENPGTEYNFPRHLDFGGTWAVSVNTLDVGEAANGRQVYVFAYNDLNLIGTPQGQALLYRQDGLTFPAVPSAITFDISNGPEAQDDNFTVIWGRVDRNLRNIGGILQGGGIISSIAPETVSVVGEGSAEAQFATWAPIPEPSSILLSVLGISLAVIRRRR